MKLENSILELPILSFRTIHFTFRATHFAKWEPLENGRPSILELPILHLELPFLENWRP
jgi:hypothetical protein